MKSPYAQNRRKALLHAIGIALLAILAFGVVASALNPNLLEHYEDADIVTGEWASRYQAGYDEGLPVQAPATYLWTLFTYTVFGEGRDGVVVGTDGWLFTSEEFRHYPDAARDIVRSIDYIASVRDALAESDVELVVALVPAKARVRESMLGRRRYPSYARDRYERIRDALVAREIPAPDLRDALRADGAFLRTDTHWSPAGAALAARILAADVASVLDRTDAPRRAFSRREGEMVVHDGDLLSFLPLGPFRERFGPRPDRVVTVTTTADDERQAGLFEEVTIPVTLVGTSYSAGELWDFAGALRSEVRADVLNVATSGEGPFEPMRDYLGSGTMEETPPTVVVWEIPERYVPVGPR